MKLLILEWNAYMQEDLKSAFRRMGIAHGGFSYEFDLKDNRFENDPYFLRNFTKVLEEGDFDGVFSMNYWPEAARACHTAGIPYIAWVYDCPLSLFHPERTFSFPTNHIFFFDRAQYGRYAAEGYQTVHYCPLAVNTSRLEQIRLTGEEHKTYGADVSFVGQLYSSEYPRIQSMLPEYEQGFLEGLIETQYQVYGYYYMDRLVSDEFLGRIKARLKETGRIKDPDDREFRAWFMSLLTKEITRRERLRLLAPLSSACHLKLYSAKAEPLIPKAEFCGIVDSYHEMPKVFKGSKININISFKEIQTGIPLRVMDILGAGGFLLTNYQEEIAEHFRPGIDCVVYEGVEDAVGKALYYLRHEDERKEIAGNGHEAVKRFSYENQLNQIFQTVYGDQYRQSSFSR